MPINGVNSFRGVTTMSKTTDHFAIEKAQSEIRTRVLEIRALSDDKLTPELKAERETLDKRYAEGRDQVPGEP